MFAARYLLAEFGMVAAMLSMALVYLGGLLLCSRMLDRKLTEREAAFLAQHSTGSRDNPVGRAPHLVGNTSHPPFSLDDLCDCYAIRGSEDCCCNWKPRSSNRAPRDGDAVSRPLYSLQGYTPAPLHDDRDTLPPADRFFAYSESDVFDPTDSLA